MGEAKNRQEEIEAMKEQQRQNQAALQQMAAAQKADTHYSNVFNVGATADGTMARVSFGEQTHPQIAPDFKLAVVMPWPAALGLAQGLTEVHERAQEYMKNNPGQGQGAVVVSDVQPISGDDPEKAN